MAPLSSSKYRSSPGRSSRNQTKVTLKTSRSSDPTTSEGPPLKKRKYVPGGPGGGGRYIELEVKEPAPRQKPSPAARRNSSSSRSRPVPDPEPPQPVQPVQPVQLPPPPPPPPVPSTPPSARLRREKSQNRGRFGSSTAAALALQQGDGYKPREERGWEEFHPDLDIDTKFTVFSAEDVDGPPPSASIAQILSPNGLDNSSEKDPIAELIRAHTNGTSPSPMKRRPGRPPRRPEAILHALGISPQPKAVPPPGPNPRERLTLPKPTFRLRDPFTFYDQPGVGQQNYVDRTMASVGYQESDLFLRHDRRLVRMSEGTQEDDLDLTNPVGSEGEVNAAVGRVEYDMDEQDEKWLEDYNAKRREDEVEPIKPAVFEITMTKIEKEWYALEKRIPKPNPKPPQTQRPRSSSAAAVNGETAPGEEQDSKCAICDDGDCENSNAIVFCDGCDLAVHQECYGVPFIPEGQWLCRKCQLIGRGSVNCIFCPNTEGAFKQTTTSKWSHLLCAIWIPEVSIGNPSLMEPITDVEKVPRSRWKLHCYICRQRMGASIQCSNKNCFVAFHVTCARRAQLYLKMKSGHGTPAVMDSHLLKAFCDKHVPPEWRREHGTDAATADAIEYYRNTMQGRRWGDSQAAALSLEPAHSHIGEHGDDEGYRTHTPRITLTVGGNKRKRMAAPKTIWKLPSGAPVIPQVVLNSVVASLQRFGVRQRKQFAEDACKYWTLKREARRGAALLKRLQLQLETFSSMEMTRRDYVAMGVTGSKRLQRRIEFGQRLCYDLDRLRMLCEEVKKREREKLKDVETLRSVVDNVYFPIFPLLWPIFEKAQGLDGKGIFKQGLSSIRAKLQERYYSSVAGFSADLAREFTTEIGVQPAGDTAELQMQISGRAPELSLEQREKRKLAKRIIKAIQPALEDAIRKESELNRKPFEQELKELDLMLENSVMSRRGSEADPVERPGTDNADQPQGPSQAVEQKIEEITAKAELDEGTDIAAVPEKADAGVEPNADNLQTVEESTDSHVQTAPDSVPTPTTTVQGSEPQMNEDAPTTSQTTMEGIEPAVSESVEKTDIDSSQPAHPPTDAQKDPLTPSQSFTGDQQNPLSLGGIQWYMQPFDPVGTTIHEERWTGRDVMRGMSEELSELDEDELKDLVEEDDLEGQVVNASLETSDRSAPPQQHVKTHRTRRRWRGFK
ncbi:putative PHD finger domain protein [Aspergillus homomorphus CBS 101889]|uniref:PHD finger domain protein n=1 Tax=Aspergillus homomorphus (strain CBS 101889) TaxID=1450537 RepID=A0A395HXY9_ASPHC|nr:PHD finger domain protein [Aspergillus homomorphus CBS 101889]RAL12791.1 PHD finger domain protein [Aspergillus homomorphus CBS 101889]